MNLNISLFNLLIIALYVIATLLIGWIISRRLAGYEGFSVAGRGSGPFLVAAAIGATNFSTATLVGKANLIYHDGVAVVWLAWNAMACVASAVIFIPIYRKLRYNTMSGIFEDRYNGAARGLISVIWMFSDTLNRYGVTVYASAIVLAALLGFKTQYMIVFMAVIIVSLSLFGGLTSVVITDALQFALMWIGLFVGAIYILRKFGGLAGLTQGVPDRLLELVPPASNGSGWPWILAMTLLGFPYFVTSQFVMQKGLSAKSVNVARWGILLAGILALPMGLMEIFGGLAAKNMFSAKFIQGINPDLIAPEVYLKVLPVGAIGVFFAALLAAGISTANGALVGVSSLFTQDFYKKINPDKADNHYLFTTRLVCVGFALIGTVWAFLVQTMGGAINALLDVVAVTDMPIFVVICVGVFWRKMNAVAALGAVVVGTIGGVFVLMLGIGGVQGLAVTTATSSGLSLILGIIIAPISTRKPNEEARVEQFFEELSVRQND